MSTPAQSPPPSSAHRLPTFSASQAFSASESTRTRISSGSQSLNQQLGGHGFLKGQVAEICGPPGSGKTALAMQVATNALIANEKVLWIDTSHPASTSRLLSILSANCEEDNKNDPKSYLRALQFLRVPTLVHLVALLLHPNPAFPPEDTALMIIDNISTIFTAAFPPGMDDNTPKPSKNQAGNGKGSKLASSRRYPIMGDLAAGLGKLAATKRVSILILNQMSTRVVRGVGALLTPAVNLPIWANAIPTRLFLHRNEIPKSAENELKDRHQIRFVRMLKALGKSYEEMGNGPVVPIRISGSGVEDVELKFWGRERSQQNPNESHPEKPVIHGEDVDGMPIASEEQWTSLNTTQSSFARAEVGEDITSAASVEQTGFINASQMSTAQGEEADTVEIETMQHFYTTQASLSQKKIEANADNISTTSPEQPEFSIITTRSSTSQDLSVTPTPIRIVKQVTPITTQEEVVVTTEKSEIALKRKRGIEEGVIPASDDEDSELSSLESDEELETGEKSSGTLGA